MSAKHDDVVGVKPRKKVARKATHPLVPDARQYYAGISLGGLLAGARNSQDANNAPADAVRLADAMIKALEDTPPPEEEEEEDPEAAPKE